MAADRCPCGRALPMDPPYHFVICACGRTWRLRQRTASRPSTQLR
jgi:hypothetical protein